MATDEIRPPFRADDPVGREFRAAISARIEEFLAARRPELVEIGPELDLTWQLANTFTGGGKRLRPAFCWWGHVAAAGAPDDPMALLGAAASLDLLHVSALMHDDVMDGSDTRRGLPAAHRQYQELHEQRRGRGSAEAFGRAGAILLGDLLVMWSEQMFSGCGLDPMVLQRGRPVLEAMRTEVTCGQVLDVVAQSAPASSDLRQALATAHRVVEFKTNRYTVQRPLQLGAALAGGSDDLLAQLAEFASPLGRAFQFRDDVLGVFGDVEVTGKPAGDDLREGKRTVLVAHALAGGGAGAEELDAMLGDPGLSGEQVDRAREIITASGALDAVEQTIQQGYARALEALERAEVTEEGRRALAGLADAAVNRAF